MKRKNRIRLNEAQLHRIIKESVAEILSEYEQELIRDSINESLNEAWYNNWSDFKRGAKNAAMGMALAGSMAAPMASCQSNPSSQQQQTPQVEYTQQITPVDQMGKDLADIYSRYPISSQEVVQKYGDQITKSFKYLSQNDLTPQQVKEYQRVGAKWTVVGNNGDGTYTVFFLR